MAEIKREPEPNFIKIREQIGNTLKTIEKRRAQKIRKKALRLKFAKSRHGRRQKKKVAK